MDVAKGQSPEEIHSFFMKKTSGGKIQDWHHKEPKIAQAATRCQARFRLRHWLLFSQVSASEREMGGVEIAILFFLSLSPSGYVQHTTTLLLIRGPLGARAVRNVTIIPCPLQNRTVYRDQEGGGGVQPRGGHIQSLIISFFLAHNTQTVRERDTESEKERETEFS